MALEITSAAQLKAWIGDQARPPATFISLDLKPADSDLAAINLRGCNFLGCRLSARLAGQIASEGGAVLDRRTDIPFNPFPPNLYSVPEIYSGFDPTVPGSWDRSFDHSCYLWFMDPAKRIPKPIGIADTIAARMHDAAMERATAAFLGKMPVVGVMGGHDRYRDDAAFPEVAKLARTLRRAGRMLVTGGGPGFMEAANLGAFLAPFPDDALDAAVSILKQAPDFNKTHDWLVAGCEVRTRLLGSWDAAESPDSSNLGIPTWLYGHEPPNVFATHVGKFFYNSLREDGLVTVASAGIVFAEGNAGTVQEVFQDATQNYYRDPALAPTPMVLYNSKPGFWNLPCDAVVDRARKKPLLPLIKQLANERASTVFDGALLLSEDVDEISKFLLSVDPDAPTKGVAWRANLLKGANLL